MRYDDFQIGLPMAGTLKEILNSDDERFGGSGVKNPGAVRTRRKPFLDMQHSARIVLPPMSCVYYEFKPRKK
ncbi:MAG: alpha amylase C-terminal domain-containing protein [Oscillospiraceae bacterium]